MAAYKMEVGDVFNETDEDDRIQVTSIREEDEHPHVLCSAIRDEEESSDTEQDYDVDYVQRAVNMRKAYEREGFHELGAKEIYRLTMHTLKYALDLAKQSTKGLSKQGLRDRLMLYNGLATVPSDADSENESESSSEDSSSDEDSDSEREEPPALIIDPCTSAETTIITRRIDARK